MLNIILITIMEVGSSNSSYTIFSWISIFSEDFEGVTPPAIPDGWTVIDGNGDQYTWITTNPNSSECLPFLSDTKFACYYNQNIATTEILRTPKIPIPSNDPSFSSFRVRFDITFNGILMAEPETVIVKLIYWSGQNPPDSIRILKLDNYHYHDWTTITYDIPSNILTGNSDTIYIEFIYKAVVMYAEYEAVSVDNIFVEGYSTNYEESLSNKNVIFKSEFIRDGRIEFISPIEKDTRLRIYSLDGTLIRDIKLSKGTKVVNVGKLNSGIYVYIVENRKGKIFVK